MTMSESNSGDSGVSSPGEAEQPQPPATPRWVKIAGVVLALIVVAVLVKVLFGGGVGGHGPGMHGSLGTPASTTVLGATTLALPGL